MKIELHPEVVKFLREHSDPFAFGKGPSLKPPHIVYSVGVSAGEGNLPDYYFNMPYWIKINGDGTAEALKWDDLPRETREFVISRGDFNKA